jgi:hypothetical protein
MAITVLIAEVICAFNLQTIGEKTKTIGEKAKSKDSAKRETQELAISPT